MSMLRNGKVPHTSHKGQDLPPECLSGTMISLRLAPWLRRIIDEEVYVFPLTSHSYNEAHISIEGLRLLA